MGYAIRLFTVAGILGGLFFAGAATRGDEGGLKVGDLVPAFKCQDDQGQIWDSRDHVGKSPIVIYFYPSDFAFCCTRQALSYRNRHDELLQQCAEVVGISGDAVEAHRLFKIDHGLQCVLLSDAEGEVAQQFGVPLRAGGKAMAVDKNGKAMRLPRKFTAARWTFIVGIDGRIIYRDTEVVPVKDSQIVLNFLLQQADQ